MHRTKKRVKRGDESGEDEWRIDTGDQPQSSSLAPRFRNFAVRELHYTQTEAGFRTLAELDAERIDLEDFCKPSGGDDLDYLIDEEAE